MSLDFFLIKKLQNVLPLWALIVFNNSQAATCCEYTVKQDLLIAHRKRKKSDLESLFVSHDHVSSRPSYLMHFWFRLVCNLKLQAGQNDREVLDFWQHWQSVSIKWGHVWQLESQGQRSSSTHPQLPVVLDFTLWCSMQTCFLSQLHRSNCKFSNCIASRYMIAYPVREEAIYLKTHS